MNIEELLAFKKADLQKLADERGIAYTAKTTNADLAEMIHAHNEKAQQNANAQDADVPQTVAETTQETRENDGALSDEERHQLLMTLAVKEDKIANLEASIAVLEAKNADLETINTALDAQNKILDEENDKLATKVVQSAGLVANKVIIEATDIQVSSTKPAWDDDAETMLVRVRITPNKGITGRIRAGMQFGVQYSEHEIDKATFDALINDAYLQVEILERDNDG